MLRPAKVWHHHASVHPLAAQESIHPDSTVVLQLFVSIDFPFEIQSFKVLFSCNSRIPTAWSQSRGVVATCCPTCCNYIRKVVPRDEKTQNSPCPPGTCCIRMQPPSRTREVTRTALQRAAICSLILPILPETSGDWSWSVLIGPELGKKMGWGHYKQKMMRELPQVDPLVQLHGAAWRPQESLQRIARGLTCPYGSSSPQIGSATPRSTRPSWIGSFNEATASQEPSKFIKISQNESSTCSKSVLLQASACCDTKYWTIGRCPL